MAAGCTIAESQFADFQQAFAQVAAELCTCTGSGWAAASPAHANNPAATPAIVMVLMPEYLLVAIMDIRL